MPNLIFSMNAGCQIVSISSPFHLEKKKTNVRDKKNNSFTVENFTPHMT